MSDGRSVSAELIERGKRGDRVALEAILRDIHPLVRNVCRRILRDTNDADDATQNTLINVLRNIERFDGRSSFTTWVYRIAANASLDEVRRRQRHRLRVVNDDHDTIDGSPETARQRVDDADELKPLLERLPEDFRIAVVLRDVMDLEYDEIAEILGVPSGTVRSRIARGRARLAELLGNQETPTERPIHGRNT